MEPLILKGKWWLPHDPSRRIAGTLNYTLNGGAELELDGLIAPPGQTLDQFDIIHGEAYGNNTVTLLDCFATNVTFVSGGLSSSNYFAHKVFIGGPQLQEKEPNFLISDSTFHNILEWMKEDWYFLDKINAKIELKDSGSTKIYSDSDVTISFEKQFNTDPSYFRLQVSKVLSFNVSFIKPQPQQKFQKHINSMQNLLTLLSQIFIVEEGTKYFENDGKFPAYNFYQAKVFDLAELKNTYNDFLKYSDIKDILDYLYKTWLDIENTQREIIELFFTTVYDPKLYFTYKFLHLIQASEVYYSLHFDNKYLSDEIFKEKYLPIFIDSIPNELHNDFRQSIKNKYQYFHYHSLRKALKEIINKVNDKYPEILGFTDSFIDEVVDSRNYLVHRSNDLFLKAKHDVELTLLTDRLYFLLTFCFMIDLNLDVYLVRSRARLSRKFKEFFTEKS
jgi:ApeA N-terminal domain 1